MDVWIFISATIVLILLSIVVSKKCEKKGFKKRALLYPAIVQGAGLGIIIGTMAGGTFLETLVVSVFLILFASSQFIYIKRAAESFKSIRGEEQS
ncbi:hypothetical protein [Halobacillus aidingensis]|uniref:Uncharacterized protein n=1 Tax=Halobacillus aidingensis TaxID=240303 RepID=A0A1H0ISP0_HALAD|nr:hypothetical protein [Halobacillus aidingensis]SDO34333.1 hypothetical protein SAMN05421677_104173 [Halobacillus aidingensis]